MSKEKNCLEYFFELGAQNKKPGIILSDFNEDKNCADLQEFCATKLFSRIFHKNSKFFKLENCQLSYSNKSAANYFYSECQIRNSFTLEISYHSFETMNSEKPLEEFTIEGFKNIGKDICYSLFEYTLMVSQLFNENFKSKKISVKSFSKNNKKSLDMRTSPPLFSSDKRLSKINKLEIKKYEKKSPEKLEKKGDNLGIEKEGIEHEERNKIKAGFFEKISSKKEFLKGFVSGTVKNKWQDYFEKSIIEKPKEDFGHSIFSVPVPVKLYPSIEEDNEEYNEEDSQTIPENQETLEKSEDNENNEKLAIKKISTFEIKENEKNDELKKGRKTSLAKDKKHKKKKILLLKN